MQLIPSVPYVRTRSQCVLYTRARHPECTRIFWANFPPTQNRTLSKTKSVKFIIIVHFIRTILQRYYIWPDRSNRRVDNTLRRQNVVTDKAISHSASMNP